MAGDTGQFPARRLSKISAITSRFGFIESMPRRLNRPRLPFPAAYYLSFSAAPGLTPRIELPPRGCSFRLIWRGVTPISSAYAARSQAAA